MTEIADKTGQCERCGTVFAEDICLYQEATAEYVCPGCLGVGETAHTPGAIRAAQAILGPLTDSRHGKRTVPGLAEIIDRETAAPELLGVLQCGSLEIEAAIGDIANGQPDHAQRGLESLLRGAQAAIAQATK